MNCFYILLISLNFPFVLPFPASGGDYTRKPYWISAGAGFSSEWFAAGAGISRSIAGGTATFRFTAISEESSVQPASDSDGSDLDEASVLGILYGPIYENRPFLLTVAAGPGLTSGRIDQYNGMRYQKKDFSLPSLAFEAQCFTAVFKSLNVGIVGFGNVNKEQSFWGILACIGLH